MPIELNLLKAEALTPILAAMAGDRNAVAADRIQTGLDRTVSSAAAVTATAARDAAFLSRGVFASTTAGLSSGVVNVASLVGGSGGTNGTFSLAFSGGGGVNAQGVFTVAGGVVTQVTITGPGTGYTSAPTISFAASAGLTGASATAVLGARNPVGTYFSVSDVSRELLLYRVDAGPVAVEVGRFATGAALRNTVPLGLLADWMPADTLPVGWYDTLLRQTISGTTFAKIRRFDPASLFALGEAGIWIDPSDRSTLFQDAAGTTPVTAYGQPVGRVLDKSGRGNHLTQAVSAARPIYAREPKGGRRNLANGAAEVGNPAFWPPTQTASGVTITRVGSGVGTDGLPYVDISVSGTATQTETYDIYSIANSRVPAALGQQYTNSARAQIISGTPPADCGLRLDVRAETAPNTVTESGFGALFAATTETALTTTLTLANAATNQVRVGVGIRTENGATVNYTIRVKGLQFERGATRTAFQNNLSAYDITEAGQPSCDFLFFDGVDDTLAAVAALPFSTTVFAAIGFQITAWPQSNVHIFTHRFGGPQNQPAVFAGQPGNSIGFGWDNFAAAGNFGGAGSQIRRDVLAYSWADGTARLLDVNGQRNTATGPIMVLGATTPIAVGGGPSFKFQGNFYGVLQINRVPTVAETAQARAYMAGRIPQGVDA